MCVHVCRYAHMHTHTEVRSQHWLSPHIFFLKQSLSLRLELIISSRLVGQRAGGLFLSLLSQCQGYRHTPPHLALAWVLGIQAHSWVCTLLISPALGGVLICIVLMADGTGTISCTSWPWVLNLHTRLRQFIVETSVQVLCPSSRISVSVLILGFLQPWWRHLFTIVAFSRLLLSETDDHVICDCDGFGSSPISDLYLFPSVDALAVISCTVLVIGEERRCPGLPPISEKPLSLLMWQQHWPCW